MFSGKENIFTCNSKADAKIINVSCDNLEFLELHTVVDDIKESFKIERQENKSPKKIVVSKSVIQLLEQLLYDISQDIKGQCGEEVLEVLRALRNCTSNLETQTFIAENTSILATVEKLFEKFLHQDNNVLLKVLVQFLINLVCSNRSVATRINSMFLKQLEFCLINNINVYEVSALLYNISLFLYIQSTEIVNCLLNLYSSDSQNEFVSFFLENMLLTSDFWKSYQNFSLDSRVLLLGILKEIQHQGRCTNFPKSGLNVLISKIVNSLDVIFQTKIGNNNSLDVYEVSLVLQILSSLSSDENYLCELQLNRDLLINVGVLLINIHRLGKESENCFSPVQKLSECDKDTDLADHPAFGFKADLVRLIGNLCWRNTEMQDLARKAELFPVLLDCSNMDARNPFIMQWTIFAIHNLCENNIQNQRIIAGLHQQGTVSSATLEEMGISLHSDGENQLKIVPYDALKKS